MAYLGKTPSQAVRSRYYFTASGGETSLAPAQVTGLSFTDANYVDVSLNGVALVSGTDYTATPSTNTISSLAALTASDVVEIVVYDTFSVFGGSVNGDFNISGGDLTLGDNDKAIFGAGSDLQIYHDGSNSYITEGGDQTGDLFVRASNLKLTNASGDFFLWGRNADSVRLYHNNAQKLETTSTGVDVTGNINVGDNHIIGDDANDNLTISSSSDEFVILEGAKGILARRGASDTNAIRVGVEGDISFFADDGTTQSFFFDASTQRLGLGTTSPSAVLDVKSSGATSTAFRVLRSSTNTNLHAMTEISGHGRLSVYDGSENEDIRLDSNGNSYFNGGNVGIGTSSPERALHVEGAGIIKNTSGEALFKLQAANNSNSILELADTDDGNVGRVQYEHDNNAMLLYTNDSERMRIDSSGNVGISRTNPSYKLHISTTATNGTAVTGLSINNNASNSGVGAKINLGAGNGFDSTSGGISGFFDGTGTALAFLTSGNYGVSNHTERMRIDSSGNLLVGTTDTTPYNNSANSTADNGIALGGTGILSVAKFNDSPLIVNRTGTNDGGIIKIHKSGSEVGSIGNGDGGGTDGIDINGAAGYVGINTGDTNNYGGIEILSRQYTSSPRLRPATDNQNDLGDAGRRFDDIYATNSTIQTSDQQEKNTITDSDLGLDFINRLSPKSYIFNGKTRTHYGLIAQDVETVLGDISKPTSGFAGFIKSDISEEEDGSEYRYGLRYTEFVGPLIQAVKDLKAENDAMRARLTALENAE